MALDNESFNSALYDLLKVRGYKPVPLNAQNKRVAASQQADVFEITFRKDGKDYGKAWASVDDAHSVNLYYSDEQQESPTDITAGSEYDDTWSGFLKHLKKWAQKRQLSFNLSNKDRLGDDMKQREYYRMKERIAEAYHPMGKKASYNDAIPNVKIIIQHSRPLADTDRRYHNVDRIFLENVDGERFLAPTKKPGVAKIYARHVAEGGVPNDERWNHLKALCEEYNQMAGFVRATKNGGQFNESAQTLITEGVAHYQSLRETLNKMTGHRGYNVYFENWTPTLVEDGEDAVSDYAEVFAKESVDPRISAALPLLSKIFKKIDGDNGMVQESTDELESWVNSIVDFDLD